MSEIFTVEFKEKLGELNAAIALYAQLSKLGAQEALWKKGHDLRIKLWDGFWNLRTARTKGGKAGFSGPLFDEARRRGWRTKIREGGDTIYKEPYASIYNFGRMARLRRNKKDGLPMPAGRYRSARGLHVAQELARRQSGIGLLGLSFLQFRKRADRTMPKGFRLEKNKTSRKWGTLSSIMTGFDGGGNPFFRIQIFTPGIVAIDSRYHIFAKAINQVMSDMAVYTVRKQMEALRKSLGLRARNKSLERMKQEYSGNWQGTGGKK
jgi:hypothetical protein